MVEPHFFWGGFECSSHRRPDGLRLDLTAATGHEAHAFKDYRALKQMGITAVRDGVAWHRIDTRGKLDWSSALPMLDAAARANVHVSWDICHYGLPDDLDIWSEAFADRLAAFAAGLAHLVRLVTGRPGWFCPVNEISYFSWAAGDAGHMHPVCHGRSYALKRQLVRAGVAAARAIRQADRQAKILWAEPVVKVRPRSHDPQEIAEARGFHDAQYQAYDMLLGRRDPDLGGADDIVDIMGLNFYPHNQWELGGGTIGLGDFRFTPLHLLLLDYHERYGGRPLFIAETGAEGCARAAWLHYVMGEVRQAAEHGVQVDGVCLYPITDYPGWSNGRICPVGLLGMVDATGTRPVHAPLLNELRQQMRIRRNERPAPRLRLVAHAAAPTMQPDEPERVILR